jgi:hypothetical protein
LAELVEQYGVFVAPTQSTRCTIFVAPLMSYVLGRGQPAVCVLPVFGQPRFARTLLIGTPGPSGRDAQTCSA